MFKVLLFIMLIVICGVFDIVIIIILLVCVYDKFRKILLKRN